MSIKIQGTKCVNISVNICNSNVNIGNKVCKYGRQNNITNNKIILIK